ncbi:MAG: Y-family DNA polymerase, partial [Thermovirgaceae bacterium]
MILALCDCNNFFVSCERLRDPSLRGKPVIVLSHNDGCVVARSNEAKVLGIGMAVPFFTVRKICERAKVITKSGDHRLYRSVSRHVMESLASMVPEIEVSSIDEAYLKLTGIHAKDPERFCRILRKRLEQKTGIPLSIGIAPTKTLAKAAGYFAKKDRSSDGVVSFLDEAARLGALEKLSVDEVWGIGKKTAEALRKMKVETAADFMRIDDGKLRERFGIHVWRTLRELHGSCCFSFSSRREPHKSIQVAPAFRDPVRSFDGLLSAAADYVADAARTLRKENLLCRAVQISIETNPYRRDLPQYSANTTVRLLEATDYTPELAKAAEEGLRRIYRGGYAFRRVSLVLRDLVPAHRVQMSLFTREEQSRKRRLMKAVDDVVENVGEGVIRLAR